MPHPETRHEANEAFIRARRDVIQRVGHCHNCQSWLGGPAASLAWCAQWGHNTAPSHGCSAHVKHDPAVAKEVQ